ncbi:MAG: hypothetical protein V4702_04190 [Patescibacteria group bacterium]
MTTATLESPQKTPEIKPGSRQYRQNTILSALNDLYAANGNPSHFVLPISVPTVRERIKIGKLEGNPPELKVSATLVLMTGLNGCKIFMVMANNEGTFGLPLASQSDFGISRDETCDQFNGFAVEIDPDDPEACVMYGINGAKTEELNTLQTRSSRWLSPDPEKFASVCVEACSNSIKHELEAANSTNAEQMLVGAAN